jgi:hypothetical protein
MDKKTIILSIAALFLFGFSMIANLEPSQRHRLQPYLTRGVRITVPVVGALVVLIGSIKVYQRYTIRQQRIIIGQSVAEGETWLLLRPKEARPVDIDKVTLWKRLAYAQPTGEHFSFELFGNSEKQGLAFHASKIKTRSVLREFFQEWPDMQRRTVGEEEPAFVPEGWYIHWVEVGPSSAENPIIVSSRDPLLGVLSEIADVPAPTRALVQVIARSDTTTRRQLGLKSAAVRSGEVKNAGVRYQRTKEAKSLEERGSRLFLQAVIRVAAISPNPDRAKGSAIVLANTLCNQFGPDNPVVILAQAKPRKPITLAARSIEGGTVRSWADNEIVALAHLPGGDVLKYAPLLTTGSAKSLPAKPDLHLPKNALGAHFEIR